MPLTNFSLDGIGKLPIFNKYVLALYLLYRSTPLSSLPLASLLQLSTVVKNLRPLKLPAQSDPALKFTYAALACYIGYWMNNRWRNGLIVAPGRIKGQEQWSKELAFVTGGAAGIGKATALMLAEVRKGLRKINHFY